MQSGYVQVAPDSTGKKVDMDQTVAADGSTIYTQKALLVADPADAIAEMRILLRQLVAIQSAILATLQAETNSSITPEYFPPP